MASSVALIEEIRRLGVVSEITVTGWDVSETAVKCARERGFKAEARDISSGQAPEDARSAYDVVLFLEVIEHLVDTDTATRNVRAVLAPDGLIVLSTPNLAAWYNRVLLLAGFQPHGTEVSYAPYRFGCQFLGKLFGEEPGVSVVTAGHLKVFTLRALKEFLVYHGFKILKVSGISNHRWDLVSNAVSRIWPAASGNIAILATCSWKEAP
jgi:SAM-dependent methyltransferase